MTEQFGAVDHFLHKVGETLFDHIQRQAPIVSEWKDGHRLIRAGGQVVTQFLNDFLVWEFEDSVCPDTRGPHCLVTRIIWMKGYPRVIMFDYAPDAIGRQLIFIAADMCR